MRDKEVAGPQRKAALVTGGTRGIGLGIARALAREGWDLLLSGQRSISDVSAVLDDLRTQETSVDYVAADISQSEGRAAIVERARSNHGAVNALVNNAGRAPRVRADIIDATEDSFEEVLRTNLQGPYFLTQAIARDMLERAPGQHVSRRDRVRHVRFGRNDFTEPRRVLRQQGRPRNGSQPVRGPPCTRRDPRL